MITINSLSSQTSKDLAQQAKQSGVAGWHSMRKEQLVRALLKIAKQKEREKGKSTGTTNGKKSDVSTSTSTNRLTTKPANPTSNGAATTISPAKRKSIRPGSKTATIQPDSVIAKKIRADRERKENLKNLSLIGSLDREQQAPKSDRLVLVVRDSFWLQAYWEITKSTVQRAKVALNGNWHQAKPVLRLYEISSDGNTNSVENFVQEIEIHGGLKNWYINVHPPTRAYRIAIGYVVPGEKFHLICKSNQVTPPPASSNSRDEHWTDITNDVEKYYALSGGFDDNTVSGDLQAVFEEIAMQPMHAPAFERLGSGINGHAAEFEFHVEAHMIVYGTTNPNGSVTIAGEPVRLQRDGSFSLKVDLPDKRQVLPVVASSRDGTQQRTTVLAVERNTKVMEPVTNDIDSD